MNLRSRRALALAAGAAAALAATSMASAASWSSPQKILNDSSSATSAAGSTNVVANLLSNGKASIVFRARGNRLWVSRRNSPTGSFGKPTRVFPSMRSITNSFDVAMDEGSTLSTAVGQSTGTNDALTGIAGAIQTSKGFGSPQRISPTNGLTYGTPSIVSNPKGDVYAAFSGESAGQGGVWVRSGTTRGGKFTATANLRGLSGTTQINPPKVNIGITNSGTVYVAFELEDGSIASWRRASSGGWTQLPTVGLPVNGTTPDDFALDVPSSGPAVIAIAQNGFIFVQRLSATGTAWTDREQVGGPAYTLPSDIPVGQLGNVLAGSMSSPTRVGRPPPRGGPTAGGRLTPRSSTTGSRAAWHSARATSP